MSNFMKYTKEYENSFSCPQEPVSATLAAISSSSSFATAATIASGIATVGSHLYTQKQNKKAARAQQRLANIEAQRKRVAQVREARIKRAAMVAATGSTAAGMGTSSLVTGAGSLQSQAASNIGFINQGQQLGQQYSEATSKAALGKAIGGEAASMFESYGGYKSLFS